MLFAQSHGQCWEAASRDACMHQQGVKRALSTNCKVTQCAVQLAPRLPALQLQVHACVHVYTPCTCSPRQATFELTFHVCDRLFHEVWRHLDARHLTQVQVAQCRRQPDRHLQQQQGGAGQAQEEEVCLTSCKGVVSRTTCLTARSISRRCR